MKRLYKLVSLKKESNGYTVLLDGKPVKTPARNILLVPGEAVAQELQREWAGQGDKIKPDTMPFTQIITTKIDRVSQERAAITASVLKYLDTDLLCYRTDYPPDLARQQAMLWDPVLQWFSGLSGAELQTTTALAALEQPAAAHAYLKSRVESLDDNAFTILQIVTSSIGSVILALAFIDRTANAEQLFTAARIEENYKAALYNEAKHGPDPAEHAKDEALKADLAAAEKFLSLLS